MKFPLRSLAVYAIGLVGLSAISPVLAAPRPQDVSPGSGPASNSISPASPIDTVIIPGPLRSFLRMAGISQEVTPPDVLPMLARNVFLHGYDMGKQTEFLVLLDRYLHLARELQALAGSDGVIRVGNCESAAPLVRILGYRFEHGCSRQDTSLTTDDAERAFLTVDSGFPITQLEESLANGREFAYPFPATVVPVLFNQSDWVSISAFRRKPGENLIDVLLHDVNVGRLYSAMARLEPRTRIVLSRSPGLRRLLPYAAVLDFYGSQLWIPGAAVEVPGGTDAESTWQSLVGVSPRSPSDFVLRLVSRDRGWLAAYFDAVARISPAQQAQLLRNNRLKTAYDAYHSMGLNAAASAGVFPHNAILLLLLGRISWQTDGQPAIPGGLQTWQEIFAREQHKPGNRDWARRTRAVANPDQFLEALVAATNIVMEEGPAQIYMAIGGIDARRAPGQRLSSQTVSLLAARFDDFQDWYLLFADFPQLDDGSIAEFIKAADHVNAISAPALRANALGAFQADLGLWQIFARQRQIPDNALNSSWRDSLQPFDRVGSSNQLFDAARASLSAISTAAGGSASPSEDEIVDMLAGPAQKSADGNRVHDELSRRIHSVLDDQRLASLDTLFGLYDGLGALSKGTGDGSSLVSLAESLHDFEMPQPIFTGGERVQWSPLIYTSRHAELQVQTDLTKVLRSHPTPQQLDVARARLAPFLRDTLVGLNYAYYEPPGAQVLHNNPLFVRSHDFSVASVQGIERVWGAPELIGVGAPAGGGAYLMGSLADLPYALASAEEDFIAPEKVQALIWSETVPQLLVSSVLPRWWTVGKNEMHATALYQRAGEELLQAAETNPEVRQSVLSILYERFGPERLQGLEEALDHPQARDSSVSRTLPTDTFYLVVEYRRRHPDEAARWGAASKELDDLVRQDGASTDPARIGADFGVPHPAFAETYSSSLLNREPFPVSGGYSSRLFAESWESSNLYWARLADEMGFSPVQLNLLVPELTRHMVASIFATYVDDWPALLRAMQQTGDQFRQGKIAVQLASQDGANGEVANGSASQ